MVITLTSWDIHIYIYDMYDIAPVILAIYIYSIKSSRTAPIPSMTYVDPQFTLRKKMMLPHVGVLCHYLLGQTGCSLNVH